MRPGSVNGGGGAPGVLGGGALGGGAGGGGALGGGALGGGALGGGELGGGPVGGRGRLTDCVGSGSEVTGRHYDLQGVLMQG